MVTKSINLLKLTSHFDLVTDFCVTNRIILRGNGLLSVAFLPIRFLKTCHAMFAID